jgi:hypothetical protein
MGDRVSPDQRHILLVRSGERVQRYMNDISNLRHPREHWIEIPLGLSGANHHMGNNHRNLMLMNLNGPLTLMMIWF